MVVDESHGFNGKWRHWKIVLELFDFRLDEEWMRWSIRKQAILLRQVSVPVSST